MRAIVFVQAIVYPHGRAQCCGVHMVERKKGTKLHWQFCLTLMAPFLLAIGKGGGNRAGLGTDLFALAL